MEYKLKTYSKEIINEAIAKGFKNFKAISDSVGGNQTKEFNGYMLEAFDTVSTELSIMGILIYYYGGLKKLTSIMERNLHPPMMANIIALQVFDALKEIDSEIEDESDRIQLHTTEMANRGGD